jgi:molybdopterin biosynthesis enzyme MoaB
MAGIDEARPFIPVNIAVLTVSDTRTLANDTSGDQKIGTSTMQSRALGGVAGGTYLFALPGSTGAVKDAWDDILVFQLDNRFRPCNLVELMPRLQEHLKPAAE